MDKGKSTGLALLAHIWSNQKGRSWDSINHSMLYALRLGIGSHLSFTAADINFAEQNFRPHHWLGEYGWQYPYALAVSVDNRSFIEAHEEHEKLEPYFGNRVQPLDSQGFTHLTGVRARCRLTLRCGVSIDGRPGEVSSMNNERVVVVLREFRDQKRSIRKLTHDDCREIWPAPKKPKKEPWSQKILAAVKRAGGCDQANREAMRVIALNSEDALDLATVGSGARIWARGRLQSSDFPPAWAKLFAE